MVALKRSTVESPGSAESSPTGARLSEFLASSDIQHQHCGEGLLPDQTGVKISANIQAPKLASQHVQLIQLTVSTSSDQLL